MSNVHGALMATVVFACGLTSAVAFAQEYDKTFLDYDGKPSVISLPNNKGTDIIYIAPGAFSRLAEYDAVVVDLPEVLISAKSEYKGAAPMDLYTISEFLHQDVIEAIIYGGYYVVDRPSAGVLYMTLAVTDLKLKRKARPTCLHAGRLLHEGRHRCHPKHDGEVRHHGSDISGRDHG